MALRDGWMGDAVYGASPVLAALSSGRRTAYTLHIQSDLDGEARKDSALFARARTAAAEVGCAVRLASKQDLNLVSGNRPHQGLLLDCSPLDFVDLGELPAPPSPEDWRERGLPPPVWLFLDEVTDPQNFGAALRSAYFLGAAGVVTCARNSSSLTAVVSKASAGAMELMPVHSVRSAPALLADAAAAGWRVLGAAAGADAAPIAEVAGRAAAPTVLVLGSEGRGLRTNVRRACQALVCIEGGGGARGRAAPGRAHVDSLNVSVATGILLHSLLSTPAAHEP